VKRYAAEPLLLRIVADRNGRKVFASTQLLPAKYERLIRFEVDDWDRRITTRLRPDASHEVTVGPRPFEGSTALVTQQTPWTAALRYELAEGVETRVLSYSYAQPSVAPSLEMARCLVALKLDGPGFGFIGKAFDDPDPLYRGRGLMNLSALVFPRCATQPAAGTEASVEVSVYPSLGGPMGYEVPWDLLVEKPLSYRASLKVAAPHAPKATVTAGKAGALVETITVTNGDEPLGWLTAEVNVRCDSDPAYHATAKLVAASRDAQTQENRIETLLPNETRSWSASEVVRGMIPVFKATDCASRRWSVESVKLSTLLGSTENLPTAGYVELR
jgi:hypothetical protein